MVIAEIPLWVTHREASTSTSVVVVGGGAVTPQRGGSTTTATTTLIDSDVIRTSTTTTPPEQSSWLLLHEHDRNKCAIYSVDVHPTNGHCFATAGGDGTVRVWSTSSLFASYHEGGRYDETAGYLSTSHSESSSSRSHNSNNNNNNNSSEDDDNDHHDKTRRTVDRRATTTTTSGSSGSETPVHDLNRLVRSKKKQSSSNKNTRLSWEGGATTTPTAAKTTTTSSSSPIAHKKSKQNTTMQHHHHHHRLLCTLTAHTGSSVLCVRWSTSGKYLASAGDDGCVCIYAPTTNTAGPTATGNLVEHYSTQKQHPHQHHHPHHWSRILLCRGHNLDVVGLTWAPDDAYLVSCSLDRDTPILVWNTRDLSRGDTPDAHNRLRQPYKILGVGVHTSTVKGVTFDPAGSYIASSGDDPAICIWRVNDWELEQRIDASAGMFRTWNEDDTISMSAQSLFRRISWSTDGAFVCSTNSVVKNKHVASTIARQGWAVAGSGAAGGTSAAAVGAATLVGHKQPIVVSRHASQWLDASKTDNNNNNNDTANGPANNNEQDKKDDHNYDDEPDYATLLALGDKRGFVTIWSTRKSKPVFKLQCSETRCTVTDLSWGKLPTSGHLILLVSLLDGQIVALKFHIPKELGPLLSDADKAKVFQLRYGIDPHNNNNNTSGFHSTTTTTMTAAQGGGGGGGAIPLVENVLQMTLERQAILAREQPKLTNHTIHDDEEEEEDDMEEDGHIPPSSTTDQQQQLDRTMLSSEHVKELQRTSQKGGKKRVQPVLMPAGNSEQQQQHQAPPQPSAKRHQTMSPATSTTTTAPSDPLQDAVAAANRAAAITAATERELAKATAAAVGTKQHQQQQHPRHSVPNIPIGSLGATTATPVVLPHRTARLFSVDLPVCGDGVMASGLTAICSNARRLPLGCSKLTTAASSFSNTAAAVPCIDLSINRDGRIIWKDELPGAVCTATSASSDYWAVGTSDGAIHLYGTCASSGWDCGEAFRVMAPMILGHAIVELQLQQHQQEEENQHSKTLMFCVLSDGSFFVYNISPQLRLLYKGSLLPAMNHILLGVPTDPNNPFPPTPTLSKVQLTNKGYLLLLLSLQRASSSDKDISNDSTANRIRNQSQTEDYGAGGSIQGFVYNQSLELWTRISDSRFVCSDYYQTLPSSLAAGRRKKKAVGPLAELDDAVRTGAIASSLKPAKSRLAMESSLIFSSLEQQQQSAASAGRENAVHWIPTRSHCEDRIACAVLLQSPKEARLWLFKYIRVLILGGHESTLRIAIHMIHEGGSTTTSSRTEDWVDNQRRSSSNDDNKSFFISAAVTLMGVVDRNALIRDEILPELARNRSLQRLASEVQLELDDDDGADKRK